MEEWDGRGGGSGGERLEEGVAEGVVEDVAVAVTQFGVVERK